MDTDTISLYEILLLLTLGSEKLEETKQKH